MKNSFTHAVLALAAIAAAGLNVAAPASVGAATRAVTTPAATAAVSHADLNLGSAAGIARLEARIRRAAESLCDEPGVRPLHSAVKGRACIADAIAAAQPQLRAAVERAAQGGGAGAR